MDGMLKAPVTVEPPRPEVVLLSKGVQDNGSTPSPVQLGSPNDLPVDGRLVFFLKSTTPSRFPRTEKIELAAADSSFDTLLELSDGSLMLEDAKTAEATLQPLARFGFSAFGPVQVRAVDADGEAGDWVPLGALVRVPGFKDLRCPRAVAKPCVLTGSNLFLASSIVKHAAVRQRHGRSAGVYRDGADCAAPGHQRAALPETARRSGDGADADAAGDLHHAR